MAQAQPVLPAGIAVDTELEERERALVQAALQGDGRSFATLVRPHLPLLFRLAARTCGDRHLAEDAAQEALSVAFQDLRAYRPGTSLRAWLAAIAVRRAHTLARAERRRRSREEESSEPEDVASPSELLGAADTARQIHAVLDAMPDKRREAALLRLDAGLPHAEIAAVVGSTEKSVRVLVHLAVKELRERLRDLMDLGGGTDSQSDAAETREAP